MPPCSLDRERLAKLLGLLGSNHDGEVLAAARQAERLRSAAGVTWADIISPTVPATKGLLWPESTSEAIELAIDNAQRLSDWDRQFIASIARRDNLSAKQMAVLARIVRTIMAARVAA